MSEFSGVYVAVMEAVVISTARTIMQINAGATQSLEILGFSLTNALSETSTQEQIQGLKVTTAGTGTGASERVIRGAAATATVTVNHTAEGTPSDVLLREGFNILNGFKDMPIPEGRIPLVGAGRFAFKFPVAPASATWNAWLKWGEYA